MKEPTDDYLKTLITACAISGTLVILIFMFHEWTKPRSGTVVLPGGITYLGPSPVKQNLASTETKITPLPSLMIPTDTTSWKSFSGSIYPYTFSYPGSLELGVFPNDPFDAVTIFWGNTNSQENVFLRVENLNKIKDAAPFISKSKDDYANWWWKQYAWKSVESVTKFKTSQGLTAHRAKYRDGTGNVPYDNVFLEVPGKPELVIWMATRLLSPAVFDKVVDSVRWGK
ncbi:hypothetical protein HY947_01840 [Candidatus Gottesmanbacteria bacterium]|nr:hypothetical protein [Candidatus Gottesmanbacteria bacterium]